MRRRWSLASKLFAALGLVLGLCAFLLVRGYAARVEALAPALGRPVTVVVARDPIPRGTVLFENVLDVASFPSRFAPPGAVHDPESAMGRTLLAGLAPGEVLTRTRLAPARAGPVAALVPPGMRAFSMATSLPRGSVRAGDHVDVLATFAGGQPHTETVASSVEILAVLGPEGTSTLAAGGLGGPEVASESNAGELNLVLLVVPDQAERMAYARAFSDLSVSVEGSEEVVSGQS
jgi:Flp pilus assembly protein CpaB